MSDDYNRPVPGLEPAEPKKSLQFQMDADTRIAVAVLSTERGRFAIADPDPVKIPIPFAILKEACAQILSVEVDLALLKLPGGLNTPRDRWPKGLAGVKHVAELLADAAELEKAGQAIMDEHQPSFKPNLRAVLGGD